MSWPITANPIRIGRESTCDIRIPQTVVSRQHCELLLVGDAVHIKHLGSVNPTLVNGLPIVDCALQAGDEIRVGRVSFLITSIRQTSSDSDTPQHLPSDTLAEEDSVYLSAPPDLDASEVHPKTDADLTNLFRISRALSRVTTESGLIEGLSEALRVRFAPDHAWLMLLHASSTGDTVFDLLARNPSRGTPPTPVDQEKFASVLSGRRGFLVPESVVRGRATRLKCAMAAPLYFGEHAVGALLLDREQATRSYHKNDLHFFVALMNVVAPFFKAIERVEQLESENRNLRLGDQELKKMVGSSKAMGQVQHVLRMVAPSLQPVLILGATGTGKELVATLIHQLSERSQGPLVTVNCAAIPRELFESEFFGHEKGAFTGAIGRKIGLLEQSDKGTLFLDEIGDLSLEHQARILRAVETGRFRRVGGQEEISADFRVVAATNKDLSSEIKNGHFREDLFHRLRVMEIRIPSLCQRRCDIPELARHFLMNVFARTNTPVRRLSPKAIEYLVALPWPGNVRELKNAIEVACTLCRNEELEAEDLRAIAFAHDTADATPLPLAEIERRHIIKTIEYANDNMVMTAQLLGVSRSTLYNKLAEYEIQR